MLAAWLKDHFIFVWRMVFVFCALPLATLVILYKADYLGPNPLATLTHTTGRSALVLLAMTLSITPLRRWVSSLSRWRHARWGKRLADWNWLIRLRRQLGLWSFSYAVLHSWCYLKFDIAYDWTAAKVDLHDKPYLLAGAASLLLLFPLAMTSTQAMVRRLGRNWRRLHMLTYVVAVLGLLHFWWMMKPGLWTPWPDTFALTVLLGYRVLLRMGVLDRWDGFDGSESHERSGQTVGNSGLWEQ
jgi:sulfoxide reductase heme-binding subunit YedZ